MVLSSDDGRYLQAVVRRITIAANQHVDALGRSEKKGTPGAPPPDPLRPAFTARAALPDLDRRLNHVLQAYDGMSAPISDQPDETPGSKDFFEFYQRVEDDADTADDETPASELDSVPGLREVREKYLAALLAAETEINGRFQLRDHTNRRLAATLEHLGARLREAGLPWHAERAYKLAGERHRQLRDQRSQDRCSLAEIRVRHAAEDRGLRKATTFLGYWLVGFGFLPFRLLAWMLIQLVVSSIALWWVSPHAVDIIQATHVSLTNYLNAAGPGDGVPFKGPGRSVLVIESYAGTISISVFFALLVRRWFSS